MLEIKNICKAYATKKGVQTRALDGVSIAFPEKGLVFILGKSGCGKSTLLNICGGLDRADEGEIVIKGRSSADFTPADFDSYRNTFVGFVFQEYNVLEEFTVEENISVALELQGKKRDAQKVADILRSVEMEAFAKRKPNTLSGGQKQRVAIARALVKAPQIILADEPTGALDSDTGRQVLDTLKRLSADKLVIAVSHDREFAERYADRIIELKDGKVLSDVTRAGEAGEAPNVRFYEDTVTVRDCAVLTEEDFAAIRRFLSSSGSGAMLSCDRAEVAKAQSAMPSAAGKFEETHGSPASRTYAAEEQQFIRSKMPFRHAFRMGASCVRTRPVRLAFSIFLCLVAFVMFGLFSTVMFFDASKATQDALYNADFTYLNYSKGYSVTYNVYTDGELTHSTTYVGSTGMTAEEYEALQERYDGTIAALETGSRIGLQGWNMQDRRFYTDTFAGYAYSAGNADMPDLLWGRYPQNAEEAAISDFTYNCLRFSAYTDPQTGAEIDIETYEDLNALPALALPGATVKIVGVYRGEQVPEKFEELRAASEEQTNSTTEIGYEWADVLEGGFYTYLLMHDSFAEQFRDYIEEPAQEGQIFESDYFLDSTRSAYILCEGSIEDGVGAFNTYTDEHGLPLLPLFSPQTADRVTSLGEGEIALPLQVYASILSTHLTAEVDGRLADADIGDAEAYERALAASDSFYDGDPLTGAQSISDILDDLFLGYTYTEGTDLFDTPVMRPFTEEEIGGMLQTVTAFMQEYAFDEPAFSLAVSSGEIQRDVQVAALFYESSGALDYCAYLSRTVRSVLPQRRQRGRVHYRIRLPRRCLYCGRVRARFPRKRRARGAHRRGIYRRRGRLLCAHPQRRDGRYRHRRRRDDLAALVHPRLRRGADGVRGAADVQLHRLLHHGEKAGDRHPARSWRAGNGRIQGVLFGGAHRGGGLLPARGGRLRHPLPRHQQPHRTGHGDHGDAAALYPPLRPVHGGGGPVHRGGLDARARGGLLQKAARGEHPLAVKHSLTQRKPPRHCVPRGLFVVFRSLVRELHLILFGQFADDAAGISRRKDARGNVARDDAARADDCAAADGDAAADDDVRGEPHVVSDGDGLGVFIVEHPSPAVRAHHAVLRQQRVHGCGNGHVGAEKALLADLHGGAVEHDEIEVRKKAVSHFCIAAVIEADGRLAGDVRAALAEHGAQQLLPLFRLVLVRIVEGLGELPHPLAQGGELLVRRIIEIACEHLFALAAAVQRVRHLVEPVRRKILCERSELAVRHFVVMDGHTSSFPAALRRRDAGSLSKRLRHGAEAFWFIQNEIT